LRVTAENVDEYISANLVVKTDRTLDVVVERFVFVCSVNPVIVLTNLGSFLIQDFAAAPPNPRDLRSPTPESVPSSPVLTDRQTFYKPLAGLTDDYACPARSVRSGHLQHGRLLTVLVIHHTNRLRLGESVLPALRQPLPGLIRRTWVRIPLPDEEPEKLDKIISKAIDT